MLIMKVLRDISLIHHSIYENWLLRAVKLSSSTLTNSCSVEAAALRLELLPELRVRHHAVSVSVHLVY